MLSSFLVVINDVEDAVMSLEQEVMISTILSSFSTILEGKDCCIRNPTSKRSAAGSAFGRF